MLKQTRQSNIWIVGVLEIGLCILIVLLIWRIF
jgi:hypothetical protein